MNIRPSDYSYIGAMECGCVVAIHTVTDPDPRGDTREWREGLAECLSEWLLEGYTVHFVTREEGCRLIQLPCPHVPVEAPAPTIEEATERYLEALRFGNTPLLEIQSELAAAYAMHPQQEAA